MIYRISFLVFFLALCACREKTKSESFAKNGNSYHSTEHLIEVVELQKSKHKTSLKIIDFRPLKDYEKGHIPSALHVWRTDIEDESYPYKGMMAGQEKIEKLFSSLGIQRNDTLIIYDDRGLCDAARLWWVLQRFNFTKVKLLNGGWSHWKQNQGAISEAQPKVTPTVFKFTGKPNSDLFISKKELQKNIVNKNLILIDTRTTDEFSGKRQKSGAVKAGRIPGSLHKDWMFAMEMDFDKRFKSRKTLEKIYAQVGSDKMKPIVAYCHTGVRSAHTTFVLKELLGYTNVKNYDGSWSEWSYFNELPTEKDSVTTIF